MSTLPQGLPVRTGATTPQADADALIEDRRRWGRVVSKERFTIASRTLG